MSDLDEIRRRCAENAALSKSDPAIARRLARFAQQEQRRLTLFQLPPPQPSSSRARPRLRIAGQETVQF